MNSLEAKDLDHTDQHLEHCLVFYDAWLTLRRKRQKDLLCHISEYSSTTALQAKVNNSLLNRIPDRTHPMY